MYKSLLFGENISYSRKANTRNGDESNMEQKKLPEKQARILYISLAAMLVIIMVISVITAINKRNHNDRAPLDTSAPIQSAQLIETRPAPSTRSPIQTAPIHNETQAPATDKPVIKEPSQDEPSEDEPVSAPKVYVMPTEGNIIKSYSVDLPVYSATMNDYRAHTGIDIFATEGSHVYCFTDGVVKDVYNDPMMGVTVSVDHGDGLVSYYQNLKDELAEGIKAGASVSAGDSIGCVGSSCLVELSDESHLHFELRCDGRPVDPAEYLSALKDTSGSLE